MQRFCICTSRQLRTLETKSKSLIYSHFNETLNDMEGIRALGLEQRLFKDSEKRVDTNQQYTLTSYVTIRIRKTKVLFRRSRSRC
ncbi:hypothetical protein ScPMuIL_002279 [Solemya velum]